MGLTGTTRLALRSLLALAFANARYWPSVAPPVRRQMRRWRRRARAIENPQLRALALEKLHAEGFNAEAAAIAATLAPRARRGPALEAIVALELMFDYLDGLTERPSADPLRDGERLYSAFMASIDPDAKAPSGTWAGEIGDDGYLHELAGAVRASLRRLPSYRAVAPVARRCAARSAQAQIHMHAVGRLGEAQLGHWAGCEAANTTLAWREFLAGAASSVLALHALIAAAADPRTTSAEAERIDEAYLSIAVVVTLLDGLLDRESDAEAGLLSYAALYPEPELLVEALTGAAREAALKAGELRNGAHHLMTLAGAVAYWASAPGARGELVRPVLAALRGELRMLVLPPLIVLRAWRAGKRASSGLRVGALKSA